MTIRFLRSNFRVRRIFYVIPLGSNEPTSCDTLADTLPYQRTIESTFVAKSIKSIKSIKLWGYVYAHAREAWA